MKIETTKQEKMDFLAGYEIHKKIQSSKISIFTLDDEQSDKLDKGMKIVDKYFDPDQFEGDLPDDSWDWLNDRISNH